MMLAIALVMVLGPDGAKPATCTLSGTLTLTQDGAAISPEGLAVVYVQTVPQDQWKPPNVTHTIVQKNRQFSENVLTVVKGDTVEFTNADEITHDAFSIKNLTFKLLPSMKPKTGAFSVVDVGTYHVQCNIHKQMRLDILAVGNPFFAKVAADGSYKITDLPLHEYTIYAWEPHGHEVYKRHVRCNATAATAPHLDLERGTEPELFHRDGKPYEDDPYGVR
jgi:plastocyanin